jgi:N-acyl-D-aspartate/D-glutamate deacylase
MFCGAGDNIWLLTEYVRDRKMLTIEEGVHVMTGKSANFFGLTDRGVIKPGKRADIAVFNLDEVERRPEIKVWDVPDGEGASTFRYSRAAAPMRLTLVNGEATFENGSFTGRFPGEFVSVTAPTALAQAAE